MNVRWAQFLNLLTGNNLIQFESLLKSIKFADTPLFSTKFQFNECYYIQRYVTKPRQLRRNKMTWNKQIFPFKIYSK